MFATAPTADIAPPSFLATLFDCETALNEALDATDFDEMLCPFVNAIMFPFG
jgi:hypothetical protein